MLAGVQEGNSEFTCVTASILSEREHSNTDDQFVIAVSIAILSESTVTLKLTMMSL